MPAHSGFHVVRDVGGVPGLHIAYEVFTEEAEMRFFNITKTLDPSGLPDRQRSSEKVFNCASLFPSEFFELFNAARDCGLEVSNQQWVPEIGKGPCFLPLSQSHMPPCGCWQPSLTEHDFCLVW